MLTRMPTGRSDTDARDGRESLEDLADTGQPGLVRELVSFLRQEKKWWLAPVLLAIGLVAVLAILAASGAAPFIYTLF